MKKVIAIILLCTFFLQVFYVAGLTIWFYANRAYISQKLCINKNRPELGCKGRCYFKRKLREAEEKQNQQTPIQEKQIKETSPCIVHSHSYSIHSIAVVSSYNPEYSCQYSYLFLQEIFHPPSTAVA